MTNLQNDYTAAKGWATTHVILAVAIGVAVGMLIGMIVG